MKMERSRWAGLWPVLLLFCLALLVRVAFVMLKQAGPLDGDALQYDEIAKNLAAGRGFMYADFPTALRPPVYPAFLAAVYRLFGHDYTAVRLLQGLAEAFTVVLTYLIGRRFFGRGVAAAAGIAVALQPALVVNSGFLLTETLYTLILTGSFYLFLRSQYELSRGLAVGAGVLLGLGALCRPTGLALPLVLAFGVLFCDRKLQRLKLAAAAALIALLTVAPWTIRNAVVLGTLTPVSNSSFGIVLWMGSYAPWDLEWRGWDEPPVGELVRGLHPARDAAEIDRIFIREAGKNIAESPLTYGWFCARKVWNLWRPTPGEKSQVFGSSILFWGLRSYHVLTVALFLVGLLLPRRVRRRDVWLFLLLLFWTALHALTFSVPRYLLPVLPVVILYGSSGAVALWERSVAPLLCSRQRTPLEDKDENQLGPHYA